ncbi:hypothetical protein Gpo141_00013022 [Globisporangium polare]
MRQKEVCKYTNPFPPLELSAADEAQLAELAHLFVHNTITQYQKYQHRDERVVDPDRWQFVKRKQDIRVYAERREKEVAKRREKRRRRNRNLYADDDDDGNDSTASSGGPSSSAASTNSHRFASKVPTNLDLPVLFVVGTLEGTLDDALFGAVNPTVEMLRTKTSYVHDNVVGAAVLATLIAPTPEDPFRTMTVKWFEKGQPLHIRALVTNRDMVFLESTGTTRLPGAGGERIGYQLLHSVHFPQTAPLATAIRGNMSICALYRQFNATSVDVFIKGYMNPAGGIMRAVVIKSAAEGMVSAWKYVHCARMKKLAWVLRQRHGCAIEQIRDDEHPDPVGSNSETSSTRPLCITCKKRKHASHLRMLSGKNTGGVKATSVCKLCFQYVCSTCRMRKKLSFITPDGRLQQNELALCALCVHDAMIRTDARRVASEETAARKQLHGGANSRSRGNSAEPAQRGYARGQDSDNVQSTAAAAGAAPPPFARRTARSTVTARESTVYSQASPW